MTALWYLLSFACGLMGIVMGVMDRDIASTLIILSHTSLILGLLTSNRDRLEKTS